MNQYRAKLLATLTVLLCACASGAGQEPSESERVESYLRNLDLDVVLMEHLRQQLDTTIDRSHRVEIADRLATLYSQRVFLSRQDAQSQKRLDEIVRLSKEYPEIASPELKMTVLHSDYANAEQLFLEWMDKGRNDSTRIELSSRFQDIGGQLMAQLRDLEKSIFESSDARLFAQAHYLYGWVCYYNGLLKPKERQEWLDRSNRSFCEFLEIDPGKPINQFSVQWFEVQSPWHARALIGLAMCLQAQGKDEQSDFCFNLLDSLETDVHVRDSLDVWRLNSWVYQGEMDRALQFLQERKSRFEDDIQRRTRLWVAAVDAASTCMGGLYSKKGVKYLRLGLRGLAADMNAPVLNDVVRRERLNLAGEDFLLAWCRGYLAYYHGELTQEVEAFESAKKELEWAVASARSSTDVEDLAKCQFLLGLVEFQLDNFQAASESLRQSIPELSQGNSKLASEAQWLVVRSLQSLARTDPRFANEAFAEMDKLVRTFPNSKYVRRVEFERLLMEVANFPPEEALRRLRRVQRDDPNYSESVFQQLVLQFQLWKKHHDARDPKVDDELNRLIEIEQEFQQLHPQPPVAQRVKALLTSSNALIRTGDENRLLLARVKVEKAGELLKKQVHFSLVEEQRYYRFQLARAENDLEGMKLEASWFNEKAPSGKFTQSVLVAMAQTEQKWFDDLIEPKRVDVEQLAKAYGRLTDLLGTNATQLEHSQNARYSAAKLAELQIQLGEFEAADQLIERLLEAFPKRRDYWVLSARAKMNLNEIEDALSGWRKVVGATEPGTDAWFEAKLGIVRCLFTTDEAAAKALFIQTVNLAPQRPPGWEDEFVDLAKQLEVPLDENREDR